MNMKGLLLDDEELSLGTVIQICRLFVALLAPDFTHISGPLKAVGRRRRTNREQRTSETDQAPSKLLTKLTEHRNTMLFSPEALTLFQVKFVFWGIEEALLAKA